MPKLQPDKDRAIRERAYFMWVREGRPEDCAQDHWLFATIEPLGEDSGSGVEFTGEEKKVLAGRPEANIPALLMMDVEGG